MCPPFFRQIVKDHGHIVPATCRQTRAISAEKQAHFLNVTPAHPASKPLENGDFEVPGGHQIWKKITVLLSPFGPNLVQSAGRVTSVVLASADTESCVVSAQANTACCSSTRRTRKLSASPWKSPALF